MDGIGIRVQRRLSHHEREFYQKASPTRMTHVFVFGKGIGIGGLPGRLPGMAVIRSSGIARSFLSRLLPYWPDPSDLSSNTLEFC